MQNNPVIGSAKLVLLSGTGSEILNQSIEIGNGINTYMISEELEAGVYYLILIDKESNRQMVKQVIR